MADNEQMKLDVVERARSPTREEVQSRPYDVIFLDPEMPMLNGLTASKMIRERGDSVVGVQTAIGSRTHRKR